MENLKLLHFDLSPACKINLLDACIIGKALEFNNNKVKYLGGTIDELNWGQHVKNKNKNKINKGIGILKKCVTFYRKTNLSVFLRFL